MIAPVLYHFTEKEFTFQYGSILIICKSEIDCISNLFTFQYGSILIADVIAELETYF